MTASAIRPALVAALIAGSLGACRHSGYTEGVKPIGDARTPLAMGTVPVTRSLEIDVGASDLRLVVGERQPIIESRVMSREVRDSVIYALETTPPECATPDVSPGRIAEKRRDKHCRARWTIQTPRIDDVRARVSVGDVDVVAPLDRAIRLRADVGSVQVTLDGRALQHGKSPGSGDEWRLGDLATRPRLDVKTDVGSIRAELKATESGRNKGSE